MAKVISIALQKGGTAKTTTALNLAAILGFKNRRVLLIDMDSQANATYSSGFDPNTLDNSLYNVLTANTQWKCSAKESVLHSKYYDIIPADRDVADLIIEGLETDALKQAISSIKSNYDYVIIDCPPALNLITVNAFVASDFVIIPAEAKPYSFIGLLEMNRTIEEVQKEHNHNLRVLGILLVKHSNRTNLVKDITASIDTITKQMNTICFEHSIREGIVVPESQIEKTPLIDYAPKNSKPLIDYMGFVKEVLEKLEGE